MTFKQILCCLCWPCCPNKTEDNIPPRPASMSEQEVQERAKHVGLPAHFEIHGLVSPETLASSMQSDQISSAEIANTAAVLGILNITSQKAHYFISFNNEERFLNFQAGIIHSRNQSKSEANYTLRLIIKEVASLKVNNTEISIKQLYEHFRSTPTTIAVVHPSRGNNDAAASLPTPASPRFIGPDDGFNKTVSASLQR